MNSIPDKYDDEWLNLGATPVPDVPVLPLWPDQTDVEEEEDASDTSEGNRFIMRICSIALVTQLEIVSSQFSSCNSKNGCF